MVEPRYDELLGLIKAELAAAGYLELLGAGVVLTGGSSKMEGLIELAEEIFDVPVRIGSPQGVKGLADMVRNPIYATGVGLLAYGLKSRMDGQTQKPASVGFGGLVDQVKRWLSKF